ncbi:MAG: lytic murein transglycosylase [Pseudomonadota bacterium]
MNRTLKLALIGFVVTLSTPALALQCSNNGNGFSAFKKAFDKIAKQEGIGKRGREALKSTQYSREVIRFDRIQRKAFKKDFNAFYKLRTTGLTRPSLGKLRKHASTFAAVEKRFGVPREVIVTIWGMETAFGKYTGDWDVINSVATLTHDCRRPDFFRPHLIAALKIVDQGWLPRSELRGARHGEIGQTQFLAANYVAYGVDFDRDGKVDLVRSVPDLLASTANYLVGHGWRAGEPYGPGTHNFEVIKTWNAATIYQQSIAKFAASLRAKRPTPPPVPPLPRRSPSRA